MEPPGNKKKWNVLVFPGGTEVGLEIHRSLRYCKEVQLFSASSGVSNHAPFVYKVDHHVSDVRGTKWIEELNTIIDRRSIDFIYPANPYVIDALLSTRDNLGCKLALTESEVVSTTRSKEHTAKIFRGILPLPRLFNCPGEIDSYPVFVKPNNSYGAQGAALMRTSDELRAALSLSPSLLIQEFLPGKEYSVDCFSTRQRGLLFCQGRERVRIRMGTSMSSSLVDTALNDRFCEMAQTILKRLPIDGAWFFQVKENACGIPHLLEIEARIAGTMALNRARGINFPLLSLYAFSGYDVSICPNNFEATIDRALINRYSHRLTFQTVYIDLDDTIILNNAINTEVIRFLFQCINEGKRIVLISKSLQPDPVAYLERHRISTIFDEMHWLREDEDKASYIKDTNSIFIDDSFSERQAVHKAHGIATFDASMIELLLSDRI